MTRDAEYLIWRRPEGQQLSDPVFLSNSRLDAAAARPWMSFDFDPSHLEIYGERCEAWSLFHVGGVSYVCRRTANGSLAWGWQPDSGEPYARPAMLLANAMKFPAKEPGATPSLSYERYDPNWALAVFKNKDTRRQCASLLASLVDTAISGRPMVALTSLECNDWQTGADLSLWIAFAVAALPYDAGKTFAALTGCPQPAEAFRLGANFVTYDSEKNSKLDGFDPDWIVWHPDDVPAPRQSTPTAESQEFAAAVVDEVSHDPRFLPSLSRLMVLDDLRRQPGRAVRETFQIARGIEPEKAVAAQLAAIAPQFEDDAAGVRAALLCQREGVAIPAGLSRTLWTAESVAANCEMLQGLPDPPEGSVFEKLCWAECHIENPRLLDELSAFLSGLCQTAPDELRKLNEEQPQWRLWRLLPLKHLVKWAPGTEPLADARLAIVNQRWKEDPAGTVRQLAGGNGWLRWMGAWRESASEADRKRMAKLWFAACEPDSLLEEWACALSLIPEWTVEDIRDLADELATMDIPPRLDYLEEEQEKLIAEAAARVRQAPTDERYRAAYFRFHLDIRQQDARRLFENNMKLLSRRAALVGGAA